MNTWLQLAITIISLVAAGVSAYRQIRQRYRAPASLPTPGAPVTRPTLNGFSEILREALDRMDLLKRENEQLRIENAQLKAALAAKPVSSRPRRTKSIVGG